MLSQRETLQISATIYFCAVLEQKLCSYKNWILKTPVDGVSICLFVGPQKPLGVDKAESSRFRGKAFSRGSELRTPFCLTYVLGPGKVGELQEPMNEWLHCFFVEWKELGDIETRRGRGSMVCLLGHELGSQMWAHTPTPLLRGTVSLGKFSLNFSLLPKKGMISPVLWCDAGQWWGTRPRAQWAATVCLTEEWERGRGGSRAVREDNPLQQDWPKRRRARPH